METRQYTGLLEVRGGSGRTVEGLCCPYHAPTPVTTARGERVTETLMPGSFAGLRDAQVPLHAGHRSEMPVSGPGQLWEDRDGLHGEWRVSDTTAGNDLLTLIRDHAVSGLSVSFYPDDDLDIWEPGPAVTRRGASLDHVAAVKHGAYPGAQVLALRSVPAPATAQQMLERRARLFRTEQDRRDDMEPSNLAGGVPMYVAGDRRNLNPRNMWLQFVKRYGNA